MTRPTIGLVIPCFNEEDAIAVLLEEIPLEQVDRVFVVDNGSTDDTARTAAASGATVIHEPRKGYGWACWSGFQAVREAGLDVTAFCDGDRSDDPRDLPRLLGPLQEGRADLVLGRRIIEPGALSAQAVWGNAFACFILRAFFRIPVHDLPSMKVIRTAHLEELDLQDRTYGWTLEMIIRSGRRGLKLMELPIHYRQRIGVSKVSGTLSGTLRASCRILSTLITHALRR
ncbi:MAG: glycosyltransferase family 2 protein [Thermaerobacterales bacterium]